MAAEKSDDLKKDDVPPIVRKLANFCYFWDLQAGILIATWIVIAVYSLSFGLNIILENGEEDVRSRTVQYGIIFVFLGFGIFAAFVAFFGMITENKPLVIIGLILMVISFIYYVVLLITSFIPSCWRSVCMDGRCPETVWYYRAGWRVSPNVCPRNSINFPVGPSLGYYSNTLNKTLVDNYGLINNEVNDERRKLFQELNDDKQNFSKLMADFNYNIYNDKLHQLPISVPVSRADQDSSKTPRNADSKVLNKMSQTYLLDEIKRIEEDEEKVLRKVRKGEKRPERRLRRKRQGSNLYYESTPADYFDARKRRKKAKRSGKKKKSERHTAKKEKKKQKSMLGSAVSALTGGTIAVLGATKDTITGHNWDQIGEGMGSLTRYVGKGIGDLSSATKQGMYQVAGGTTNILSNVMQEALGEEVMSALEDLAKSSAEITGFQELLESGKGLIPDIEDLMPQTLQSFLGWDEDEEEQEDYGTKGGVGVIPAEEIVLKPSDKDTPINIYVPNPNAGGMKFFAYLLGFIWAGYLAYVIFLNAIYLAALFYEMEPEGEEESEY